ncbi:MAG: glutamate--cysteine ligase [Gammaproteobacteria bacterium]|nr:glutamate--cysteine ligase [Gammaproteobacteria bacterium]MDH5731105.1 glutamate--cysteine ligase [Gammaproteobacteria bacterium]
MGDEITNQRFKKKDYKAFYEHLIIESQLLEQWFANKKFDTTYAVAGFEQEAWLVNHAFSPEPMNESYLAKLNHPLLSPELARFNIELNVNPVALKDKALSKLKLALSEIWQTCEQHAAQSDLKLLITGILPTLEDSQLTLANMSAMNRYRALNEQVMHSRKGKPLRLDIVGVEHLKSEHFDVMLESAATSFQIHRQIALDRAARYMNAAIIGSAPLVAISVNSPFLFGRHLWEESRIPLFEQSVELGGYGSIGGPLKRVTFGSAYVEKSLMECFSENLEHYPILLPVELAQSPERLPYLRLHNGTIWRWNRPLIGFENHLPHLRVEHRVCSAGPTITDEIANTAFCYGLHEHLSTTEVPPESQLDFAIARDNFYNAARFGLSAHINWLDQKRYNMRRLLLDKLIPMALSGLERLKLDAKDIEYYISIIQARVESQQTGAAWQRSFVEKFGSNMQQLTQAYYERQQSDMPVHEWDF